MPERNDVDIYADFTHDWTDRSIWPFMGVVVQTGIAKLEDEGFTREEATLYLKALTILQLHRMDFPLPPIDVREWVPEPKVYTEQELMAMLARGETIPQEEYTGFEGTK